MKHKQNQTIKYLTASPTDELWGLYITTIGSQIIAPHSSYPPKSHPSAYWFDPGMGRVLHEYILLYITAGGGVFESRHCKPVKIVPGTVILLFPDEWHTYKPNIPDGWTEYWVGFNGVQIESLMKNNFFAKKSPIFNVGFNEQLVSLFQQGIETAFFQKTAHQQVLTGITSLILGLIHYSEKNNAFRDKEIISQIDKARMLMRESVDSNVNPASIAASLNLSYSWFRRIFKQYTGFAPAQYQMEIKLQKSKELLTSTGMPVKEIAFDLGFESVSYFVTFFKSRTGMSPTEYRDKVKGKLNR